MQKQPAQKNIENQIEAAIRLGRTFTAYDITKMLRIRGFWIKHDIVRDVVHAYTLPAHYTKVQQLILGAPAGTTANVFHKTGVDPLAYNPNWVEEEGLTPQAQVAIPKVQPTVPTRTATPKANVLPNGHFQPTFGSRNRMSVGCTNVTKADLKFGDSIRIEIAKDCICIAKGLTSGRSSSVGKNGVVRLRKDDFVKAFGSVPQFAKYICIPEHNMIKVVLP